MTRKGGVGPWNPSLGRKYVRGRVDVDVDEFCGWKSLLDLTRISRKKGGVLSMGFVVTAFLTGGRVSEILNLKRDNFEVQDKLVVVRGINVLKRWKKIFVDYEGSFIDSKDRYYRTERKSAGVLHSELMNP